MRRAIALLALLVAVAGLGAVSSARAARHLAGAIDEARSAGRLAGTEAVLRAAAEARMDVAREAYREHMALERGLLGLDGPPPKRSE